MNMLDTIKYYADLATNDDVSWGELAGQVASDAAALASETAAEVVALATEEEAPVTPPEKQAIPSLPADDSASTFITEDECFDTAGQALVNSVKPAETSWWAYTDSTAMLSDAWSSVTSTVKDYIPDSLKSYFYGDEAESQDSGTDEISDSWYSPVVALARSVANYVMGESSESSPAVVANFQSAESVYSSSDEADVCLAEAPVEKPSQTPVQTQSAKEKVVQTPVDFYLAVPTLVTPVNWESDEFLYTRELSDGADTCSVSSDLPVESIFVSPDSMAQATLLADQSFEAVSLPSENLTAESVDTAPASNPVVVTTAQDHQATFITSDSVESVAANHSTSYLSYGDSPFASYDSSAFFGAQWLNTLSASPASVGSGAGAALLGDSQNLVAFNQSENANLVFGTNHSFGSPTSAASQMSVLAQEASSAADGKFAVGASALPASETTLFSSYASVAQAAAASLKTSSEILHAQQASRAGVSSVLPSPFPMVFVNGLVTTLGTNKEQALAVAALNRPLVAVEARGQMSSGSDSDQRGRQNEAEALAFDEAAPIANAASVQTGVASANDEWDATFTPEVRDVFVGA